MQLKFINAQPATDYYAWQVEVVINQFIRLGYNPEDIHVVGGYTDSVPDSWIKLQKKFHNVKILTYKHDFVNLEYQPAIQSALLKMHWDAHPYLKDCAIFFHDADFVLTRYFDFNPFLTDDTWHFSDTISYIGADYIKSKSPLVLDIMCHTVGIDRYTVESNQQNSGGAQKLMKNVNSAYWEDVFHNSINLYDILKKVSHIKQEGDEYGIQVWTASMWAELWTAWKSGYKINVPKEFDFSWATCNSKKWDSLAFFHNAGVPNSISGMFFKAQYIDKYPFSEELDLDKNRCSSRYFDLIKSIDSCLI
jgi:hypothetical protein